MTSPDEIPALEKLTDLTLREVEPSLAKSMAQCGFKPVQFSELSEDLQRTLRSRDRFPHKPEREFRDPADGLAYRKGRTTIHIGQLGDRGTSFYDVAWGCGLTLAIDLEDFSDIEEDQAHVLILPEELRSRLASTPLEGQASGAAIKFFQDYLEQEQNQAYSDPELMRHKHETWEENTTFIFTLGLNYLREGWVRSEPLTGTKKEDVISALAARISYAARVCDAYLHSQLEAQRHAKTLSATLKELLSSYRLESVNGTVTA